MTAVRGDDPETDWSGEREVTIDGEDEPVGAFLSPPDDGDETHASADNGHGNERERASAALTAGT